MARRRKGSPVHGWVVLDKPVGMTSTQAVGKVRYLFDAQKAGHGGTLGPLAPGLLPIALGEATKTVSHVMDGTKSYRFTIAWGVETDTDDAEGTVTQSCDKRPNSADIKALLPHFTGEVVQVPPKFSAIKVDGERAYALAREGQEVDLQPRTVEIGSLELIETPDADHARLEADCGKGTYVRALARDLGRALGCLGHVAELRRTRVGPFDESDMISLDILQCLRHSGARPEGLYEHLRSVETALDDIPALAISSADAARMRQGQAVIVRGRDAPVLHGTVYVACRGTPVALAEYRQGALYPKRVFNLAG